MELKRFITDIEKAQDEKEFHMHGIYARGDYAGEEQETQEELIKLEAECKKYEISPFKSELFSSVEKIEDIDLHIEILSCFQFYEDFSSILKMEVDSIEQEKNELDVAIFSTDTVTAEYLKRNSNMLQVEIDNITISKNDIWETLETENMLAKIKNVHNRVKLKIEEVKQVKNNPPQV
ncbi:hypothetical protein M4D68_09715 [Priestia aryabhattai]|uniref:hypothetical protein n=1 Tax=Priestia aryabhattai TaxID=412384 RepID=UPI00203BF2AA|nr:hypothetical protein [Priestia aryabhattai]MCM3641413.1 hypothetical protein [Priestia aryabhattai]